MEADAVKRIGPTFPVCDAGAVPWISVAEMREVDRAAIELGVTLSRMMENAGAHLALLVDSILGYGRRGSPRGGAAELIAATAGARVLSLDVPSGVVLESGAVCEPAVRAEATMTLALPKAALRLRAVEPLVGRLYLADIAIPPAVLERMGIRYGSPFARGPVVRLVGC